MLNPCENCIALAFQDVGSTSADTIGGLEHSAPPVHRLSGLIEPLHASPVAQEPEQCSPCKVSAGVDGVSPPGPFGACSDSSLPLACPRHRGGRSWSMQKPCDDCIALAFGASL